ncbi:hypothetical protein GGF46_005478 [Coemansia sp. RSA 552]|nr:hypothetical protein GGF46_005478 [Coemansia sp. RSA 552]
MAATDTGTEIQHIEMEISRLVEEYSDYDWQLMLTPFSDGYCQAADTLLGELGLALCKEHTTSIQA